MSIKRTKVDVTIEKKILTGLIVSDQFISEFQQYYIPEFFELPYATLIAEWCFGYYDLYKKAPNAYIEDLFMNWTKTDPDDDIEKLVAVFLSHMSKDFERSEKFNHAFLMDEAIKYLNTRAYTVLAAELRQCITANQPEEAERLLNSFKAVEKALGEGVDPFNNKEVILNAFSAKQEPLFRVPGKLGKLLNDEFTRDSFVAFMGPEKRGKSFWLMYFAFMAHKAGCNVAFFQAGDMSENQMVRRQMIYLAQKSDLPKYCNELYIPILDCVHNQSDECGKRQRKGTFGIDTSGEFEFDPNYAACSVCSKDKNSYDYKGAVWYKKRDPVKPLSPREAYEINQKYLKRYRTGVFKLSTHPARHLNVAGIKQILEKWERTEEFVPDVILIDYADIMAPEKGSNEFRHQQNETWMALRGLSQQKHACVITATQASASSYSKESVGREDFSEDKRKYAHVTAMFALNQTQEEKKKGLMRIAPILIREDDFDTGYNVRVLQCLQIGRPYLASF